MYWFAAWGQRIDVLLTKELGFFEYDHLVFRPDELAREALFRFSTEYAQTIRQVLNCLEATDRCFEDVLSHSTEAHGRYLVECESALSEWIRRAAEAIADAQIVQFAEAYLPRASSVAAKLASQFHRE